MSYLQKTILVTGLVLGILNSSVPAQSQTIDPRFPILGKSAFGLSSVYAPDSVMVGITTLNPAAQNQAIDVDVNHAVEANWGKVTFREGFALSAGILSYFDELSDKDSLRISLGRVWSNTATIPQTSPLGITHSGNAVEVSYARRLNKHVDVGIAVTPQDQMKTELSLAGQEIASGKARSRLQFRTGVMVHKERTQIGFVYSHDSIDTDAKIMGASEVKGKFLQRSFTGGIAYTPRVGTTLFYNRQGLNVEGEGLDVDRPSSYWGIQQFLSKRWSLRLARVSAGSSVGVTYLGKDTSVSVSFTERAFSPVQDFYGRGSLVAVSVAKKF